MKGINSSWIIYMILSVLVRLWKRRLEASDYQNTSNNWRQRNTTSCGLIGVSLQVRRLSQDILKLTVRSARNWAKHKSNNYIIGISYPAYQILRFRGCEQCFFLQRLSVNFRSHQAVYHRCPLSTPNQKSLFSWMWGHILLPLLAMKVCVPLIIAQEVLEYKCEEPPFD